ncbi:zinc finger protein 143-like isoform X1 [Pogonomyrmex barbatus]|uniref:Zinc finger protein 143-like isoform X1 n=1 Tax=Pogonomyrmex barbatus TaxID=144034 RepID=A0A8N1SBY3_9HYME|nr:zinc finger protein 143-like isoform X1 [Pogonomyrmex barbatus]XP_025075570.1 zinc finger protein 143-like isoform X1 [Pogonomyrmex barbatus]XP_025075571.1 zinc finger protein 143-like isoform X1 [Pogonomyrmex barbatus]XP_025075572.1 zinc finger protein 143-like isoform X1 [Pogonomyrmex barbatus]XP_025075573.1 zinc finger protein 143-like isoform X1 [Pogonomyrmex barbatus]
MSAQNADLPSCTANQEEEEEEEEIILHDPENNPVDILECLSVMINDDEKDANQVQELILDDQLFGTMVTTITLPDGTQAFVTNNLSGIDSEFKTQALQTSLENGDTILLRDLSELGDGKALQLELDPATFVQAEDATTENVENTYSQVEFINGTAYMVASRVVDENLWEIKDGKLKKKDPKILINKLSDAKIRHPCPREGCSKVYSTPHHLKVHERSHTGQRPYRCNHPKCKKSFSTGYSLKAHSRTHTGEKPYKCTNGTCNKSFKTSGDLLKHVRTHTGERPFVCPYNGCGRSFTTSNIRKVHVRTHTGERPYQCTHPTCGKAFASATNYKNHIRIHSGEKPYVCSIENCGRRFTEYSSLYKHHLVHTPQRLFECTLCSRKYRQSSTLIMHKRTAHSLVDSDDGVDTFLQDSLEPSSQNKNKKRL